MRLLLSVLFLSALSSLVQGADIAIEHGGSWETVSHSTTAEENTAALYYRDLYDGNLCESVGLARDCSKTAYGTAGGTETFYDRTALGAKEFFMDQVIKKALQRAVSDYERDLTQRARNIWVNELSMVAKESTCTSWGKNEDCTEP
jgi:hypothetical protein